MTFFFSVVVYGAIFLACMEDITNINSAYKSDFIRLNTHNKH